MEFNKTMLTRNGIPREHAEPMPSRIHRPYRHMVDRMSREEKKAVWDFFLAIDGDIHAGNALLDELQMELGYEAIHTPLFQELTTEIFNLAQLRDTHALRGIFLELCFRRHYDA